MLIIVFALVPFVFPNADARGTIEEYCNYSVENQLPTPWDYHCYDDPFGNPQREMNLESNAINDDYRNCGIKDTMKCFEYSQEICRPSYFHHYQNTGEGDPIYFSVFLKEDCTIHVIVDNRRDMYSSIEDRRLYQTVCPDIELRDDHIILDSCKELEPFNGSYESFRIVNEKSEPYLEPEPLYENGFMCPPGKVFDWDICVDECPFGQIPINDICMSPSNGGGAIDLDPDLSPTYAYDFANGMLYRTILPLMGLALVIASLFLVPYFILKRKNILPRRYMLVITASILIFFSIGPLTHIGSLAIIDYNNTEESQIAIIGVLISMSWGIAPLIIGIILLKKAKLRIRE